MSGALCSYSPTRQEVQVREGEGEEGVVAGGKGEGVEGKGVDTEARGKGIEMEGVPAEKSSKGKGVNSRCSLAAVSQGGRYSTAPELGKFGFH